MDDFQVKLNDLLVDTFTVILKYESQSLSSIAGVPVTIGEAHTIDCIARLGGEASVSQIAQQMRLAMPTTTVAVKKLEQKGYVVKTPSPLDGRRVLIRLTEQGERIDRAHSIFHQRMVHNISNQFEPTQRDILLTAVAQLNTFFRHQTKAAS